MKPKSVATMALAIAAIFSGMAAIRATRRWYRTVKVSPMKDREHWWARHQAYDQGKSGDDPWAT